MKGDVLEFRGYCTRCLRASSVCYCAEIAPFQPSFEVILLQHPRERRNSIGTARLTHLCLENSKLICDISFDRNAEARALLDSPERHCVVLFPDPTAINISVAKEELFERAEGRLLTIFAIDGTWSQAKSMLRASPRLSALPKISFTPDGISQYRIRRQPKAICLSTVESVHRVVQALEPTEKAETLLRVFALMVDAQVKCAERGHLRENFRPRPTESSES